jgi:hypothetical protein
MKQKPRGVSSILGIPLATFYLQPRIIVQEYQMSGVFDFSWKMVTNIGCCPHNSFECIYIKFSEV